MGYQLKTEKGYDFYEVASALQKTIRRGDTRLAGYFALELLMSGYHKYVWKRLLTISAEDCAGILTQEIEALRNAFDERNKGKKNKTQGRVFLSKAVILLSEAEKSRDADHMGILIYDKDDVSEEAVEKLMEEIKNSDMKEDMPEYVYDCHTRKGKSMGKTKEEFLVEEDEALTPRREGVLDDAIEKHKKEFKEGTASLKSNKKTGKRRKQAKTSKEDDSGQMSIEELLAKTGK